MITSSLTYAIDPAKVSEFETYGRMWVPLVERLGGTHHGYLLPHEGASDIAYAHFSFPSLAAYGDYRNEMANDPDCQKAYAFAQSTQCIKRYDHSFTRPVLTGAPVEELN